MITMAIMMMVMIMTASVISPHDGSHPSARARARCSRIEHVTAAPEIQLLIENTAVNTTVKTLYYRNRFTLLSSQTCFVCLFSFKTDRNHMIVLKYRCEAAEMSRITRMHQNHMAGGPERITLNQVLNLKRNHVLHTRTNNQKQSDRSINEEIWNRMHVFFNNPPLQAFLKTKLHHQSSARVNASTWKDGSEQKEAFSVSVFINK